MSGVGNYIHFGRIGYKKHGITRNGEKDNYNFKTQKKIIQHKAQALRTQLTPAEKRNYENHIANIFSPPQGSNNKIYQEMQNAIFNKLQKDFSYTLNPTQVDWGKGNIKKLSEARGSVSKLRVSAQQKEAYLSTVMKRIRGIEQIQNEMKQKGQIEKANELQKKIDNVYKQLKEIVKIADLNFREGNWNSETFKNIKIEVGKLDSKNNYISNQKTLTLYSMINEIIHGLNASTYLMKGNLFEYAGALAGVMINGIAENELEKTLKSFIAGGTNLGVVGGNKSKIQINFGEFFSSSIDLKNIHMNKWQIDFGDKTAVSYLPSQEKIDIMVDFPSQKNVGISAKNINFKANKDIHLVSGTSLLYLIQDENSQFVNHYLNIAATHPKKSSISLGADWQGAHEAMKYTVLYKALSGDTYGRNKASLFLVNDNSRVGGIKIYEMADLLNKAFKNIDKYATIGGLPKGVETIQNRWAVSGPEERIAKFLSTVHNYKIYAALKLNTVM